MTNKGLSDLHDNAMPTSSVSQNRHPFSPWSALPIVLTIYLLVLCRRAAVDVPFADEQQFSTLYAYVVNGNMPPITELLASHNGHPYLTLKLIMSGVLLLGLPWKLLMYAQPLLLAWCFYITVRCARLNLHKWQDLLTYIALALMIITPRIWEDLFWGMQISAQLCLAFTLLSFAATSGYIQTPSGRDLAISLGAACIASVSAGAGILVPPMVVATIFLSPTFRDTRHLIASGIFLILSTGLTVLSFKLSAHPGMGQGALDGRTALDHAIRMFAHLYYSFREKSKLPPYVGIITFVVFCFTCARLLRKWPQHVFPLLCAALGCALIGMITYARVKAGIFQPDASRYVPDLLPLSIGLLLLLRSTNARILLIGVVSLACVGYVKAAAFEWHAGHDRKGYRNSIKIKLCQQNTAQFNYITPEQVRVMQTLYCKKK
jgi:hypothetical protein